MYIAKKKIVGARKLEDCDENPNKTYCEKQFSVSIPSKKNFGYYYYYKCVATIICYNKRCSPHLGSVSVISIIGRVVKNSYT